MAVTSQSEDLSGTYVPFHTRILTSGARVGWFGLEEARSSVSTWGCPSISLPTFSAVLALFSGSWLPSGSSCLSTTAVSWQTLHTSLRLSLLPAPLRLAPWAPGQFLPTHKAVGCSSPFSDRTLFLCLWNFSPRTPSPAHLESSRSVPECTLPSTLPPCVPGAAVRGPSVPAPCLPGMTVT